MIAIRSYFVMIRNANKYFFDNYKKSNSLVDWLNGNSIIEWLKFMDFQHGFWYRKKHYKKVGKLNRTNKKEEWGEWHSFYIVGKGKYRIKNN